MRIVIDVFAGIGLFAVCLVAWIGWIDWCDKRQRKKRRKVDIERRRRRTCSPVTARPPSPPPQPVPAPRKAPPIPRAAPQQRKPANANLPRVECSVCKRKITLTKEGKVRVHGGRTYGGNCRGSGKRYVQYLIHEEPV